MTPRNLRPKAKTARRDSQRAQDTSQPDVQISYTAAGQETLAAIAEELSPKVGDDDDGPFVSISEEPAGRETLALISESLQPARPPQSTLSYGDRISNAPGAKTPSTAPAPPRASGASAPEISVSETGVGRETLAVITEELASGARAPQVPRPEPAPFVRDQAPTLDDSVYGAPLAIFEMLTFVIQGPEITQLAADAQRRRFVETHLLLRLPTRSMDDVERVDVTPWTTRGTVVLRVWCRVPLPSSKP